MSVRPTSPGGAGGTATPQPSPAGQSSGALPSASSAVSGGVVAGAPSASASLSRRPLDLVGMLLVSSTELEGARMSLRYPPAKRNLIAPETLQALGSYVTGSSNVGRWEYRASATAAQRLRAGPARTAAYELPSVMLAPVLAPKPALCKDGPLELYVTDTAFVGWPAYLSPRRVPLDEDTGEAWGCGPSEAVCAHGSGACASSAAAQAASDSAARQKASVTMFSIVFVLSRGPDVHGATRAFANISRQLAQALVREEARCGWVSSEVAKMTRAREMWMLAQMNMPEGSKPDMIDLTEYLLHVSPLCSQLRDIFHRMRLSGTAQVSFNGWTSLCISLWDAGVPLFPQLRPYHALMLVDHELSYLSFRCSPSMALLLKHAKPSKSLRDLELETGIPLKHIYQLVSHLVYWRCAVVRPVVSRDSFYVINPRPVLPICGQQTTISAKFARDCPSKKLGELLDNFNRHATLGDRIDMACSSGGDPLGQLEASVIGREFVQQVCWLLSHNLIMQLHTYVYLVFNSHHPSLESCQDGSSQYRLLRRIAPMLDGRNHLEEIKWRANIDKAELGSVLLRYNDILICVQHEEV